MFKMFDFSFETRIKTSCVDHKDRNDMWPTAAFAYSFTMPIAMLSYDCIVVSW